MRSKTHRGRASLQWFRTRETTMANAINRARREAGMVRLATTSSTDLRDAAKAK